jgi:hypothetical protein
MDMSPEDRAMYHGMKDISTLVSVLNLNEQTKEIAAELY